MISEYYLHGWRDGQFHLSRPKRLFDIIQFRVDLLLCWRPTFCCAGGVPLHWTTLHEGVPGGIAIMSPGENLGRLKKKKIFFGFVKQARFLPAIVWAFSFVNNFPRNLICCDVCLFPLLAYLHCDCIRPSHLYFRVVTFRGQKITLKSDIAVVKLKRRRVEAEPVPNRSKARRWWKKASYVLTGEF